MSVLLNRGSILLTVIQKFFIFFYLYMNIIEKKYGMKKGTKQHQIQFFITVLHYFITYVIFNNIIFNEIYILPYYYRANNIIVFFIYLYIFILVVSRVLLIIII